MNTIENEDYLEMMLYNNKWVPNGRSIPGRYVKRLFFLDTGKSLFGYYSDIYKTKLEAQYSLKVYFAYLIGYTHYITNSYDKFLCQ